MDHVISPSPDFLAASRHAIAASRSACDTSQALITASRSLIASATALTSRDTAPPPPRWRPAALCAECRRAIDSPGVMIVRGRMVVHVACDTRQTRERA